MLTAHHTLKIHVPGLDPRLLGMKSFQVEELKKTEWGGGQKRAIRQKAWPLLRLG